MIDKNGSLIKSSPAAAGFLADIGIHLVTLIENQKNDYFGWLILGCAVRSEVLMAILERDRKK
jgi:hypothetical protein